MPSVVVIFVDDKPLVFVTDRQENILSRMNPALFELLVQPGQVQSHVFEIALQNPPVHNQFGELQLLLWGKLHIAGGYRALGAHRKNGQPSIELENCGLNAG